MRAPHVGFDLLAGVAQVWVSQRPSSWKRPLSTCSSVCTIARPGAEFKLKTRAHRGGFAQFPMIGRYRFRMLTPDYTQAAFRAALQYSDYVRSGTPDQRDTWSRHHARVQLTGGQRALIGTFTREINILVSSGIWCGDCAAQVPMLDHIAVANPRLHLRLLDRDEHSDFAERIMICGGLRVPTVLFLNEDFEFLSLYGDKSLARMRARAAKLGGAYCDLPGMAVGQDEAAGTLADWVAQVEFAHLIARLSPKLRDRHGD
jgi:hypothetical protein